MTLSKMVIIEMEVEVEWEEDETGLKTLRSTRCHTIAPQVARHWAENVAWMKVAGRLPA